MSIVAKDYVVLDVETNGLSSLNDDLLSISIYQPDTQKIYNRFFPLELGRNVYTTHINGITKKDLAKATQINDFLNVLGLIEQKSDIPTWMDDLKFFDDEEQERNINNARDEIEAQKQKIKLAEEKLKQNLHYKSILFETGDTLVKVVFDILEKMLNCSLADFVDKKGEDFKIALQDITFIGEIKGITSNVKNENVSQLDVHYQTYIDGLDEDGKSENVKGILIINPLRNKPLNERDEVHEKQVQLATRNGSLIITTETLLLLFMAYLQEHITTDKIIELLKNKIGLLSHSDFI